MSAEMPIGLKREIAALCADYMVDEDCTVEITIAGRFDVEAEVVKPHANLTDWRWKLETEAAVRRYADFVANVRPYFQHSGETYALPVGTLIPLLSTRERIAGWRCR